MTPLVRRVAAGLLPLVLVVAACGGDDDDADRSPVRRDNGDEETTTTVDQTAGVDLEDVPADDQDDAIIEAVLGEVESFWADEFPSAYGDDFEPVTGGFIPYGPDRNIPVCGFDYADIAGNAFYCLEEDLIAWDSDNLTNDLLEQFGPFSLAIVVAHEYGHAVQVRAGVTGPTIAKEQQADCFAGSFTAFVEQGGSDVLNVSIDDLDAAVAGFLTLRDTPGTPSDNPAAHGSAFDRIGAFQDGFLHGTSRCVEYEEIYDSGGTTVIDLQFSPAEFQTGGNAPFDDPDGDIFDITLGSLETFWAEAMPAQFGVDWDPLAPDRQVIAFDPDDASSLPDCPGTDDTAESRAGQAFTCVGDPDDPDDDFVAFDINLAAEEYDQIGDFAVSGIISGQYSLVAQELLGNRETDRASLLQTDCFSGAWAGELTQATVQGDGQELDPPFDDIGPVSISAGDLDEAVQSFLLLGQSDDADPQQGSPFERVAAFRDGFLHGLPHCATYLDGGVPDEDEGVPTEDSG